MKYYAQKFKSVIISFQIVFTSITAFYLLGDLYDLAGLTPPFFTKRKRGLDCVSRSAKAPNKVRTRMWRGPRLFSMSHIAARSHPLWRGPSFFLSKGLLMCPSHLHWWEERKGKGERGRGFRNHCARLNLGLFPHSGHEQEVRAEAQWVQARMSPCDQQFQGKLRDLGEAPHFRLRDWKKESRASHACWVWCYF